MNAKQKLWHRLSGDGDTMSLFPGQPVVEILGTGRVLIEGHRGVREYGRERIRVAVKGGWVCITGSCLELRCMNREQLVILGCIRCVEVSGRDGK